MPAINITGGGKPPSGDPVGDAMQQGLADRRSAAHAATARQAAAEAQRAAKSAQREQERMLANIGRTTVEAMKMARQIADAEKKSAQLRDAAEVKAAKDAERAQAAALRAIKARDTAERRAAREAERAQTELFKGIGVRTNEAMRMAKKIADAEVKDARSRNAAEQRILRQQEREERRVESQKQQRRAGRVRAWERAGTVTGIALAGAHGDVEGITTLAGMGIGALFGPLGAEIGSIAGEILGKLVKGIATLPMAPGQIYGSYLQVSQPWMDLKTQGYAAARAGGFSGAGFLGALMPGNYRTPGWMSALGVTPESAMQLVGMTGLTPRSPGEFINVTRALAGAGLSPEYSGMNMGQVAGAAGTAATAASTNISVFLRAFAPMMTEAVAAGTDRSKLFGRMTESLEQAAAGGAAGVSSSAISAMYSAFLLSGAPGGRTGTMAAGTISTVSETLANPFRTAAGGGGFLQAVGRYGNLRTEANVRAFVGETAWSATEPGLRSELVKTITGLAQQGNLPMAAEYAGQLASADPGRYQDILYGNALQMSGGNKPYAAAVTAIQGGGKSPYEVFLRQYGRPRAELMAAARAAAQKYGVPEQLFLAQIGQESSWDPTKRNAIGAAGIAQFMPGTARDFGINPMDPMQSLDAAAKYDRQLFGKYGTWSAAIRHYGTVPSGGVLSAGQQTVAALASAADQPGANVPSDVLAMQAEAAQQVDTGAKIMFENFGGVVRTAASAAAAVREFANSLDQIKAPPSHVFSGAGRRAANAPNPRYANVPSHPVAERTQHSPAQQ